MRLHNWSYEEERALVEFIGLAKMDPKYGIYPQHSGQPLEHLINFGEILPFTSVKAHHQVWF